MTTDKPVIGITMGDPCGVGAEIVVKALADSQLAGAAHYVVFGFSEQLAYTADLIEVDFTPARMHHEDYHRMSADVVVLDFDEISQPAAMPRGPSRVGGQASMAFCESAIAASLAGDIDAMVTAPISKTSWQMAGIKRFPGHTELLAERCNVRNVAMMFVSPKLRVALATIHQALFDIRNTLTIGCVFNPIDLADQALKQWFGIEAPRIAIAGLNPHAGEDGRFGDEESRIISPAVLLASEAGMDVTGPLPADVVFRQALEGQFDCVIAMYHDQALIPIKLLAWENAVNVTLGLPIIRTSPDHGTAFDIAGRNKANPSSLIAAIELAVDLVGKRACR